MEDDLIFRIFLFKRKMTSINLRMEDDLKKKIYIYITNCTAQHILPSNLTNKTN